MAPAPTTRIRIVWLQSFWLIDASLRASGSGAKRCPMTGAAKQSIPGRKRQDWIALPQVLSAMTGDALPLFPERADFQLKRPGAARLLVKLPVRGGNRRRRHQQV